MKTYYSILSVQIRPEIQERISIGFLLADEGKVFFNYSKNKLKTAKSLLNENMLSLLRDSLKNIENTAAIENLKDVMPTTQLFIAETMKKNTFSADYLTYLSRYNNNVLIFSSPKQIDLEARESVFKALFHKFIDETELNISGSIRPSAIESFKRKYTPKFKNHFNIDKEVSSKEIPRLVAPVKLFLYGKNDQDVFAQAIEIADRRIQDIDFDLGKLFMVRTAYTEQRKKPKAYLVSKEPPRNEKDQHDIWRQLWKSTSFEYVDVSEAETILDYARKHNVQPIMPKKANKGNT